jgi:carboxylesterase type B
LILNDQFTLQSASPLACLRLKSASDVLAAAVPITLFVPIADGVDIVQYPFDAFYHGDFNKDIPLVIGYTEFEGNLFVFGDSGQMGINPYWAMNSTQYAKSVTFLLSNNNFPQLGQTAMGWYANLVDQVGYWHADSQLQGDFIVNCATDTVALSVLKHTSANVYRYEFTHASSNWLFKPMNATHAADMAYVFHTDIAGVQFDAAEDKLSLNIIQYITNFLEAGDPNKGSCTIS